MSGRRLLVLSAALVLLFLAVPVAMAADGDLETGFNGTGKLSGTLGGSTRINGSVVQPDGKLIVVGSVGADGVVARYDPNGILDPTFGATSPGITVVDSGMTSGGEVLAAVALQGDKIVAVGQASLASTNVFVLARLNSNGLPDETFDGPGGSGNGVFRISQGTNASAAAIAVSGNKVIFVGSVDAHSFVYQLNDNGTLDTTGFGSPNGYLTFDFPGGGGLSFLAGLAIQQSDGKIIAVGHPNGATGMGVARITTTGALDTTFNPTGSPAGTRVLAPPTGYADGFGRGVIADPSGEILVGGYVESFIPSDNRDPAIAAVTPAGALDTAAFAGGTGYALLPLAGSNDQANGLARQPDGKLVIGGTAGDVGSFDFLAARFSASGVLDTGFASPAGYTTTDFSGATSTGSTLALSNTGVAYVGGNAGSSDFGIAAFHAYTPPPTGNGGGGGGAQPAAPSSPAAKKKCKKKKKHRAAAAKKCKKRK